MEVGWLTLELLRGKFRIKITLHLFFTTKDMQWLKCCNLQHIYTQPHKFWPLLLHETAFEVIFYPLLSLRWVKISNFSSHFIIYIYFPPYFLSSFYSNSIWWVQKWHCCGQGRKRGNFLHMNMIPLFRSMSYQVFIIENRIPLLVIHLFIEELKLPYLLWPWDWHFITLSFVFDIKFTIYT